MHRPLLSPSSCLIWGLSSVSVTQYHRPCSPMALTEPGLTRRDRLSHVAGDALLACCLSLHLTAVSWMQPDNGLRYGAAASAPSSAWHQKPEFKNTTVVTVARASVFYPLGVEPHLWPVVLSGSGHTSGCVGFFHHRSFCQLVLYQSDLNRHQHFVFKKCS